MNASRATVIEQMRAVVAAAHAQSAHLLDVLHALQQRFLHVPREAIVEVAARFNLLVSQVEAVAEFHSFFSNTPCGRYHVLFSTCTSCGCMGDGENLMTALCQRLNVAAGETRGDGLVSIGETSCIGLCDHGVALLVNGTPLVRVDDKRIEQIAALIEAEIPLAQWPGEWFKVADNQRRSGLLLDDYFAPGAAVRAMLARGPAGTLDEIVQSNLRGRGGAGFPTGMKWKMCQEAQAPAHYVVCNADEGEPGTFKDRVLLHSHADRVFEGMTLCARVVGAEQGYLYLRGEYRYLLPHLQEVLERRREQGVLGGNILGQSGFRFDITVVTGAGAYICGEESALLESLEGKRGIPRSRPPFPVTHGYLGQPTVVDNVETFVAAAHIALRGGAWFCTAGTGKSTGSKILSISGDCVAPGIYEYPFGVSIREILADCGAQDLQAVQVGGPSGVLLGPADFERRLGFEDIPTGGSFLVFSEERDLLQVIRNFSHFFAHESCGFCTPCRVGTVLLKNAMDKIAGGHGTHYDVEEMKHLAELVKRRSHCGLGQSASNSILDGLQRFPQLFERRLVRRDFEPYFDLDAALQDARQITHRNDAAAHLQEDMPGVEVAAEESGERGRT